MSGNTGDSLTAEGDATATLPPGARLGKYEIRRLLGAGGMGAVYEAHHTEIGKRVAIKVLAHELAAAPGARTRFLREAQLTSKINHPNIVDVNDMGNEDGRASIVMEFLDGEDLSQWLDRTGPLPVDQLIDIMLPVCSAVAEAHRVGITHRDLKPQNIFLASGPRGVEPKVLDFVLFRARADPGRRFGRPAQRSVRAGGHPLRVSDGAASVRGGQPVPGVSGDRRRQGGSCRPAAPGAARPAATDRRARHAQGAHGAVRVGLRDGAGVAAVCLGAGAIFLGAFVR
jgi:serine/threonine protein kinase